MDIIKSIILRVNTIFKAPLFDSFGNKSFIASPINSLVGGKFIRVGDRVKIGRYAVLTAWANDTYKPEIVIDNGAHIGDFIHISAINKIIVGENCLTGRFVTISDNSHGEIDFGELSTAPLKRKLISKGPVIIGKNVWIGDKVTILANVTIGDGAIIGANSVVTKDIPPYTVAAGIPAKIIKTLQ